MMKNKILVMIATAAALCAANPAPALAAKAMSVTISTKGSNLQYDKTEIKAKAGQTIKLTFMNKAAKDSGLQHNWVLAKPGTEDAVGQQGITAGPDKGYVPDSPNVLAHTKLVNAGQKDTITFKAPAQAGSYPYMCTFPGHYAMMKGTLVVK